MRDSPLASQMPLIVVVEDDPPHRALLGAWLKKEGYQVQAYESGLDAKRFLEERWADLLILDWNVPGMPGDRLLKWVRGRTNSPLPVLFQTVHCNAEDITCILDAGADDYIVKPVDRAILLARIRALLRRYHPILTSSHIITAGSATLNEQAQSIATPSGSLTLGVKEFDIAWYLALHRGTLVQRQELMRAVWGIEAKLETRSVDMYMSRLRARLAELEDLDWHIQSVYGQGYRLNVTDDQ